MNKLNEEHHNINIAKEEIYQFYECDQLLEKYKIFLISSKKSL